VVQVASPNDEGEQSDGSPAEYCTSTDLELGSDGGHQLVGLRFQLNVPQGSEVFSASLEMNVDETRYVKQILENSQCSQAFW
jgi:hypothetical protein